MKKIIEVPTWALLVLITSAAIGWMAVMFILGQMNSNDALTIVFDFAYVLAQAAFVGSSAGLFFRYLTRNLEKSDETANHQLSKIELMLENKFTGPFTSRDVLPPIKDLIEKSMEIFYVGGNCRSLLNDYPHHFERWVKEGKKFIFLLQDPENEGLRSCEMPCANYDYDRYTKASRDSIERLKSLSVLGANVELYLTKMTPTQSIVFVNPEMPEARLSMFLHMPNGESHTAPCISFSRGESPRWYDLFYTRYEDLKNNSKQVVFSTIDSAEKTIK